MPRVLVVDDHALFREALASLISSRSGWEVVGQAGDGADAVRLVETLRPDLVLMDISMPGMDGVEATRAIKENSSAIKIAMLTMLDDEPSLLAALNAGADGYMLKDCSPQEMFEQLETVAGGRTSVPSSLAGAALVRMAKGGTGAARLSRRELEILRQVASGASNKVIAANLGIAENTVKKHLGNLMDKLGVDNRTQLALYSVRAGFISQTSRQGQGAPECQSPKRR